jgi:putative flippase GtrA
MSLITWARAHKERILLVARYALIGAGGAALQIGTFYVWISVLHLETHYLFGSIVSLGVALIATFGFQKYWTFKDTAHTRIPTQFASYVLVACGNLLLNIVLLRMAKFAADATGIDFFHTWYLVAQAGIVLFVALLSFLANYFFTFRLKASPARAPLPPA